jgi:two-component system sensor kinase FixL
MNALPNDPRGTSPGPAAVLRGGEARWRSIVENAVDGIILIDAGGRIEFFNRAAERLFGYTADEVAGLDVAILMPSPDRDRHASYLDRYLSTGERRVIGVGRDVVARRKDGTTFPAHLSVAELSVDGVTSFAGTVRDLTDRHALEARLRDEAALARVGELAAVLAHEVKNPLAAVSGAVQMLGERLIDDDRAIVDEVLARIDALNALMGDLLLYARPPQPTFTDVRVVELLEALVAFLECDPAWAGLEVRIEPGGVAGWLRADGELLRIALQNLLLNALQAMQATRASSGRGAIVVSLQESAGQLHIDVRDAGEGIAPHAQARLFTPFFTTKARGTGLGLATVRRIAGVHGGEISVLSTGPGGTTMRLSLPVPPSGIR